jgi:hypothetical protein
VLAAVALISAVVLVSVEQSGGVNPIWSSANSLTSAALLGAATTAMLIGHSYLIAPNMSLTPLFHLLTALFATIGTRATVSGAGLGLWTSEHTLGNLDDVTLLLPLRWGFGVLLPLVLTTLAWQTAKIRSTQSATGILYIVVIFAFLGELISQLLFQMTSLPL